jgi:hypothetical protein
MLDLSIIVGKPMRGGLKLLRPRLKGRIPQRGKKAERGSTGGVG